MPDDLGRAHGLDGLLPALDVPDDVLPLPEEPWVKPGELYVLGEPRLLCADATDPAAVRRLLDGAEPRLLVTDPPYGVRLDPQWRDGVYNDRLLGRGKQKGRNIDAAKPNMQRIDGHRNTTISDDTIADWSPAFALVPSLAVAYVWHGALHAAEVAAGLMAIGFDVRGQIIWAKTQFAMSEGAARRVPQFGRGDLVIVAVAPDHQDPTVGQQRRGAAAGVEPAAM